MDIFASIYTLDKVVQSISVQSENITLYSILLQSSDNIYYIIFL
jgi:hypothetical protein